VSSESEREGGGGHGHCHNAGPMQKRRTKLEEEKIEYKDFQGFYNLQFNIN
jgi:hypothetical protein